MPDTDKPVVFLMPNGTEVSNDPRYDQQKMREQILADMENTGYATRPMSELSSGGRTTFDGTDAAGMQQPVPVRVVNDSSSDSSDDSSSDEDETDAEDYSTWKVADLKAEAQKRDISLTDITKKSQLIAALQADDEANQNEG